MAEFCKQCAEDLFGPDEEFNDAKAVYQAAHKENPEEVPAKAPDGVGLLFLCEGCGHTIVNEEGACVYSKCLEKHGESK